MAVLNLRQALLPVVDQLRGIPDILGLRQFTVTVVSRTWSGSRVGLGSNTDTSSILKVDLGTYKVRVTQVTSKDIALSGGLYTDEDLKIGPFTPPFQGSTPNHAAISTFDPPVTSSPTELFFNIKGPGYPSGGGWYTKVSSDTKGNFRYSYVIRRTAEIP